MSCLLLHQGFRLGLGTQNILLLLSHPVKASGLWPTMGSSNLAIRSFSWLSKTWLSPGSGLWNLILFLPGLKISFLFPLMLGAHLSLLLLVAMMSWFPLGKRILLRYQNLKPYSSFQEMPEGLWKAPQIIPWDSFQKSYEQKMTPEMYKSKGQWDTTHNHWKGHIFFRKRNINIEKDVEKLGLVHGWWESKRVYLLWKALWWFLKKFNIELLYNSEIPLQKKWKWGFKYICMHVHRSVVHHSQKVEAVQMSNE